jgi:RNA polymerase sigma-70 factor (ECF subfamily)
VAEGNSDALETLYHRHIAWLGVRLSRRCADPAVVEEVLQDTFVAVWRGAGRWDGSGDVGAWIWGIAIRRLIDSLRRHPVRGALSGALETEPSAEEAVLAGVEYGDLAGALNRLSPELRAVVQATILDDLTTKEAGRLLGIPAGTVKTRMMRARAQLREELA